MNIRRHSLYMVNGIPVPRVYLCGHTYMTKVLGTGEELVSSLTEVPDTNRAVVLRIGLRT